MPNINRIRVNNVKYNFGTQYYDNFTMRMYGKNTLYDLANGGGKSVLMLLLLQNLIPNCTLDDKQPVEKLFRENCGNTTIHSLIEWKLDACDIQEGYRYMTTGFCARKARDAEEETDGAKVASVEYFNYCIFYRQYNQNDIINLPLEKDGEKISYQALRNYLKDLEHHNQELIVKVFDKKGEYQRFISGFGLHESQWEIIRGINKTEGHVRTYFETNYKTTRKVVEDLLIEEIIEKAFLVKTERDSDGNESMARLLMDIKDQLAVLAGKKKDIAGFDHQMELLGLLSDRITSFLDIYQEKDQAAKNLADIYVTAEEFAGNDEKTAEVLQAERDEKKALRDAEKKRIECLKTVRDKRELERMQEELEGYLTSAQSLKENAERIKAELALKESMGEYIDYLAEKKKADGLEYIAEDVDRSEAEELLYTCVYNLKRIMQEKEAFYTKRILALTEEAASSEEQKEMQKRLLAEAELQLAVAENNRKLAEEAVKDFGNRIAGITAEMDRFTFDDLSVQIGENERKIEDYKTALAENAAALAEMKDRIEAEEKQKAVSDGRYERLREEERSQGELAECFRTVKKRLDDMCRIYLKEETKDYEALQEALQSRIERGIITAAKLKQEIADCDKQAERLKEKRIIEQSEGAAKVIEYVQTRHGGYAMYGMDYISALPDDRKEEILAKNPELPYGVLVQDYETLSEDPNIRKIDIGSAPVLVYDMEELEKQAVSYMPHVFSVRREPDDFRNEEIVEKGIRSAEEKKKEMEEEQKNCSDMLAVEKEDLAFLLSYGDDRYTGAEKRQKELQLELSDIEEAVRDGERRLRELQGEKQKLLQKEEELREIFKKCEETHTYLLRLRELSDLSAEQEERLDQSKADIKRLTDKQKELAEQVRSGEAVCQEIKGRLSFSEKELETLKMEWETIYAPYENGNEYPILPDSEEELKQRFHAVLKDRPEAGNRDSDRKLLIETLHKSMERILNSITAKGISVSALEELHRNNELYPPEANYLRTLKDNMAAALQDADKIQSSVKRMQTECSRMEGKIEYAVRNIEETYGSYEEEDISLAKIAEVLREEETFLKKLTEEAAASEEKYLAYRREQGAMTDLYKDVKRIVTQSGLSVEGAVPVAEEKNKLREHFEEVLVRYDKAVKLLERAKNELLRFKGTTAETLYDMGAFELANAIRDDVSVPVSYAETRELLENLKSMTGYIALEKERVEKSLADMERLKQNFEEQCLERCLDVKSELDKLPGLSTIVLDGEPVQMVGLSVPYVKEEFMRNRMSEYIEKIVAFADTVPNDKERLKYIRNSLALKKLFGVIVTDMNHIRLTLYKRERIVEQSRYLKYEEAVGSTGQSQGIYIQFLISIINYISGMYAAGQENERTKTVFIDNPFGAAKDIYIWEPIFALLKANNVQLIVPARGATPAISGRFDVNYVLGQQMTGKRQVTVVVQYTSKTKQEELEYHDLEYEQETFDFI